MAPGCWWKKADAQLTAWMKDVAPSARLRQWFGHDPERFAEFRKRYQAELANNPRLPELRGLGRGRMVTLLYAARDPGINHAKVLQAYLKKSPTP